METEEKRVEAVFADGRLTVTLAGEIDHHSARPLREAVDHLLEMHKPRDFRLSLERVNFMDSSGLGLILGRLALCRAIPCPMTLTNASERMKKIFLMAGLGHMQGLTIEGVQKKESVR